MTSGTAAAASSATTAFISTQNASGQGPEEQCRRHFPPQVIALLASHLGYNLKDWTIAENLRGYRGVLFLKDGIHLGSCSETGELDILIVTIRESSTRSSLFSYKDGIPTNNININPLTQGSEAEKIAEGFEALQKEISAWEKTKGVIQTTDVKGSRCVLT